MRVVANLMANKLLYALSPDAIWQTLARNVFPTRPRSKTPSGRKMANADPANDMDYFYMMGARHRRAPWRGDNDLDEKKKAYNVAYWMPARS